VDANLAHEFESRNFFTEEYFEILTLLRDNNVNLEELTNLVDEQRTQEVDNA
jgi:hypothetical protein